MYYNHDISDKARRLLEGYNSYFGLSEEEIAYYCELTAEGVALPEDKALNQVATLSATTDEREVYWTTVKCLWGFVNRNSINNNEDVERKERLVASFRLISPPRLKFKEQSCEYLQLVKTVLHLKADREIASILAFGLFVEMDTDYLFWEDLQRGFGVKPAF